MALAFIYFYVIWKITNKIALNSIFHSDQPQDSDNIAVCLFVLHNNDVIIV